MTALASIVCLPAAKLACRTGDNSLKKNNTMGDKSPKSNQKKSNQKQSAASSADQKKKQALADKATAMKKK